MSYVEYKLNLDLKILDIWAGPLSLNHFAVFEYIRKRYDTKDPELEPYKREGLYLINFDHIKKAIRSLNKIDKDGNVKYVSDRTLRQYILDMAKYGLLTKQNWMFNKSKRLYCGVTDFYYNAEKLAQDVKLNLTLDQLKSAVFPNGYVSMNHSECNYKRGDNGEFLNNSPVDNSIRQNSAVGKTKVTRQNSAVSTWLNSAVFYNSPNKISYNIGGYKEYSYKFISDLVENPLPISSINKGGVKDTGINWLYFYGKYLNHEYELEEIILQKILTLLDLDYNLTSVLKHCLLYLEDKAPKLWIKDVRAIEFVNHLTRSEKLIEKNKKEKTFCPACEREYENHCTVCGYNESLDDLTKKALIDKYKILNEPPKSSMMEAVLKSREVVAV